MSTPDEPTTETPATQPGLDDFDFDFEETPAPVRRRRLPLITGALALCAAIGGGVVLGIAIQKHWGGSGSSGGSRSAASLAAALAGRTGQSRGSTGAAAPGGFTRSGTAGQVKAIDGKNLYVTDTDGNVVKVTTDPGVSVRVTKTGTLKSIAPGDFVVVQGTKTKSGYRATSITDSGTSASAGGFGGLPSGGGSGSNGNQGGTGGTTQPALPGLP